MPRRRWFLVAGLAFAFAFPASVFADAPTAMDLPSESTPEDTLVTIQLSGGDTEGAALTFVRDSDPVHGTISNVQNPSCDSQTPSTCTEDVDYTPAADYNGMDSFTYHTNDGALDSGEATVTITVTPVNDAPTAADLPNESTNEDTADQIVLSGSDVDGSTSLTFSPGSPGHGQLTNPGSPTCDGLTPSTCTETIDYTPDADYNGPDSFTYTTNDGYLDSAAGTATISVTAVNDPPSFTKGADPTVLEDAGPSTVAGWATAISAGPADESTQTLTFHVTNDTNAALFSAGPAIDPVSGDLTFTPAANANGSADVTIDLTDDGGVVGCSGACDTSPTQVFTIHVTPVNDPPSFTKGANKTVLEDAGAQTFAGWATAIKAGPTSDETSSQTVTFHVSATNTALFSSQPGVNASTGTLTFTPATNANGSTTVTVYATDSGGTTNCVGACDTSASQMFTIAITAVNDPPSFTKGANETVLEDAGPQTFTGWATAIKGGPTSDELTQTVTLHPSAANTALFSAQPAIDATTGNLTFTPATNANGSTTVTVYATDNGGTTNCVTACDTSANQTFTIAITAVNDPPSFTKGSNQTVLEDSPAQTITGWATSLSAGPSNETGQTFTFQVTGNTNAALFASLGQPAIGPTGTLTYQPAGTATGTATITVTLQDSGGTANCSSACDTSPAQTFTITVNALVAHNDGATVAEGAAATAINVLANDNPLPNPQPPLTIHISTAAAHGTATVVGSTVTYKPATRYYGTDTFKYTITDGTLTSLPATVVVTVTKDLTPPVTAAPIESISSSKTMGTSTVTIKVQWSATDPGSGVVKYELWRQVDAGTWTLISLPTATTTSISTTVTVGHSYRFRVRATDFNGNASVASYGPTFKPFRYEEGSSTIVYSSPWTLSTLDSGNSGGYTRYTSTAGKTATFTITARDIAFVAPTSSSRGSLKVYVDGVLVVTISEKTASHLYRQVLWARHFAGTTETSHAIKVVAVGGARVDIDCFLAFR